MAEMKFLRKRYMEKRCHMIGSNHYQAKLGRGVGEAFTLTVKKIVVALLT